MKIVVIGAGPIGGIVGGRLAREGYDITLVDIDTAHVQAICEKGLWVDVPDGAFRVSVPAVTPKDLVGQFDVGLVAVRSNYTRDALAVAEPHLHRESILVSLQNGMNPPLFEEVVGSDRTVGAVVRMRSVKPGPGHVKTTARGRLFIGHLHGRTTPGLHSLHSILNSVIPTTVTDNILGTLWSKLSYTCVGMLSSLAPSPMKEICKDEANRRLFIGLLGEIVGVGVASGVRFEPLAEYHPSHFAPNLPYKDRLAAFNEAAKNHLEREDRVTAPHSLDAGVTTHVEYVLGYV
ncbi:MAG: NAD(P)-binding domain-containing protein, partial [Deltaproteobacteria bacterium]|nr:NAD(P)-binding domain-containing protein [Deltaproteobacteria bacterium]